MKALTAESEFITTKQTEMNHARVSCAASKITHFFCEARELIQVFVGKKSASHLPLHPCSQHGLCGAVCAAVGISVAQATSRLWCLQRASGSFPIWDGAKHTLPLGSQVTAAGKGQP